MSYMSLLTLHVAPENVAAVLAYYRRERVLEKSGAASSQLSVDDDDPGTVLVTAVWTQEGRYACWLESPLRARFTEGVAAAAGSDLEVTIGYYRVVHQT